MAALRLLLLQSLTKTKLQIFFEIKTCNYLIIFHGDENSSRKPSNSAKLTVIILLATVLANW